MSKHLRVLAGDCTTTFAGDRDRTQRGRVVVLIKPDNTTLVHDADGYQPVEWLTRPDSVTVEVGGRDGVDGGDSGGGNGGGGFTVTATDGDSTLRVIAHEGFAARDLPITEAGVPVGTCPDCDGPLVRAGGAVVCQGCEARYGLPAGATVSRSTCEDCGLPTIRVERGEPFRICLDPRCEPLEDAVSERFDGVWGCPDCDDDLRVRYAPGRVFLGCADRDCGTTLSIPSGTVVDDCPCGLPVFETASGRRCLDGTCERWDGGGGASAYRGP